MTLYTAIGRYEMRQNKAGEKVPYVTVGSRTHELDLWEMILWSSLIWNIRTCEETRREFYRKEREAHVLGERTCEDYLERLEKRGLIACGHGATGMDALHDLLNRLYVVPATANLLTKAAAFVHLTLVKRIPLKVTRHIFDRPKFDETEKKLMRLAKQNLLSVGELVKSVECGVKDVSTNAKLMDALYNDEDTDYTNIGNRWRGCDAHPPVLCGIAELYLGKHILFDMV